MKVWFKRLPGDPSVSVSVAVPYGSDMDPPGKEQLAHFTEHMLFSDHMGRTEEQIKREIEDLGGVRNGYTAWDRTFYFARVRKQHALFALDWLYRIISPHEMRPEIVDRQREPVALEVGARPRELFDWLYAHFLHPPLLRLPDFWRREFGLSTAAERDIYYRRSLYQITPQDLRGFYDRYYVPGKMTLTVVGDLDRDAVFEKINQTFARLPSRPATADTYSYDPPDQPALQHSWMFRSNVYFGNSYKFFGLTREQELRLIFLGRFLGKRLNARLRFGERKAVYGVSVYLRRRGPVASFEINGGIKETEFAFARRVVEEELAALRDATLPQSEFETYRAAVARELRTANTSSKDLENWVWDALYNPDRHRDFPDLVSFSESIQLQDLSAFVRENFVPARHFQMIARPMPISQGAAVVLGLLIVWGTVRMAKRLLTRPVDMTRIRYVARLRMPLLYSVIAGTVFVALGAVVLRLLIFCCQWITVRFLLAVPSFWVQITAYALMLAILIFVVVLFLALVPRKVLLFDDRLLVKFLAYRSTLLVADDISELRMCGFREVWLTRRLWRCVPLALGLLRPGIYLRTRAGRAYFFHVRKPDELIELLQHWRAPADAFVAV